ncbi:MAG: DUF4380 domain-containing protein [Chloroflexi bacterium]|nr:DUF4380 domain-containing protein [Chloroflexota bacterium]
MKETRIDTNCRIERIVFRGWRALHMSNGLCDVVIVPDIGGRVMAFDLGPYSFLWINERLAGKLFSADENMGGGSLADWRNYGGSKTWPAPQGWERPDQWHGPPDPVLDSGRYDVTLAEVVADAAVVEVRSPADPLTGVQITRRVTLHKDASHVSLHLEMTNVSEEMRTWGLWDVVQLDASRCGPGGSRDYCDSAWLYVPTNPQSRFARGYHVMFGDDDNPEWQPQTADGILGIQYQYRLGKIGVDSHDGWLAFVNRDVDFAFCQRFTYFADERYPDDGATIECWTTGWGEPVGGYDWGAEQLYHVEAEVLGPLRTMRPGTAQSFDIEWNAARCPGPIVGVTDAGCCSRRLQASRCGPAWRVQGTFGAFARGSVDLVWLDDAHHEIVADPLGAADPLQVLELDVVKTAPEEARFVNLRLRSSSSIGGLLDEASLTDSLAVR